MASDSRSGILARSTCVSITTGTHSMMCICLNGATGAAATAAAASYRYKGYARTHEHPQAVSIYIRDSYNGLKYCGIVLLLLAQRYAYISDEYRCSFAITAEILYREHATNENG